MRPSLFFSGLGLLLLRPFGDRSRQAAVHVPAGIAGLTHLPPPPGRPTSVQPVHLSLLGPPPVVPALLLLAPIAATLTGTEGAILPAGQLLRNLVLARAHAEGQGRRRLALTERHLNLAADEIDRHPRAPWPGRPFREGRAATTLTGRPPPTTRGSGWRRRWSCRRPPPPRSAAPARSPGRGRPPR